MPLRENYYHGLLTGYLLAMYPKTYSNLEAGKGFFDIQVTDGGRAFIMEVKRTDKETDNLELLAEQGLQQIAKRRYDVRLVANPAINTVLHWSIAFCKKSCFAKVLVAKTPSTL